LNHQKGAGYIIWPNPAASTYFQFAISNAKWLLIHTGVPAMPRSTRLNLPDISQHATQRSH
jgi:hypothetical protein